MDYSQLNRDVKYGDNSQMQIISPNYPQPTQSLLRKLAIHITSTFGPDARMAFSILALAEHLSIVMQTASQLGESQGLLCPPQETTSPGLPAKPHLGGLEITLWGSLMTTEDVLVEEKGGKEHLFLCPSSVLHSTEYGIAWVGRDMEA